MARVTDMSRVKVSEVAKVTDMSSVKVSDIARVTDYPVMRLSAFLLVRLLLMLTFY